MIVKTTLQVTVLQEADSLEDAAERLGHLSLSDLGDFIDEGDGIGGFKTLAHVSVSPGDVEDELLLIGNDGTFFDHDVEEV